MRWNGNGRSYDIYEEKSKVFSLGTFQYFTRQSWWCYVVRKGIVSSICEWCDNTNQKGYGIICKKI